MDVAPFSSTYESISKVEIVKAGTAWDDPETGQTFILVMSQALGLTGHISKSFLNPNQLQANNV